MCVSAFGKVIKIIIQHSNNKPNQLTQHFQWLKTPKVKNKRTTVRSLDFLISDCLIAPEAEWKGYDAKLQW